MIKLTIQNNDKQKITSLVAHAYNLFRRKEAPELVCAVPEDRAVPQFIAGESWEFQGKINADSSAHQGFDDALASAAARYNGFYLFHSLQQSERDVLP